MKKTTFMFMGGLVVSSVALAQDGGVVVPPVVPPSAEAPDVPDTTGTPAMGGADVSAEGEPAEGEGAVNPIEEADGGFLIKDAALNDIFQLLAKRADKQYFHNNKLNTDEYKVTGHLKGDADALTQMEELAFQYGLRMYVKGNTVYAMMTDQLEQLPAKEWTYSLRYLRPTDIEQIKALIQPMLTAGRGIVNFEPKTNTIVVIDTTHHIEMVERLLRKIDKPKGQIVVEVKIMRVNSGVGQNIGVDWSSSLGSQGVSIDIVRSLNSVFGLGGEFTGAIANGGGIQSADGANIILSPLELNAVLRALNEGGLLTQKSNPVIITEDNEKALISLIDRVPIITTTTSQGTSTSSVSEEVRYTIDESDSTEPDETREIGVTIAVTPSLLPDGSIRMKMRPRSAEVTEYVESGTPESTNRYPRVSEATIENIARIPDGNSLIIGGFYKVEERKDKNKVPLLGDIPVVNFFFKSKSTTKEQSSLVFCVTPTSYDPSSASSSRYQTSRVSGNLSLTDDHDWVDSSNPGPAHEANWDRTIRGMKPKPPVCYPPMPAPSRYPAPAPSNDCNTGKSYK